MFPIGLYVYYAIEKKDNKVYQAVFDDFYLETLKSKKLTEHEKIVRFEKMLEQNGYKIIEVSDTKVVAQKKILSMGLMMIGIGIYFIGLLVYLLYYFHIQKPHEIVFALDINKKDK
jgi:hypothetical protein